MDGCCKRQVIQRARAKRRRKTRKVERAKKLTEQKPNFWCWRPDNEEREEHNGRRGNVHQKKCGRRRYFHIFISVLAAIHSSFSPRALIALLTMLANVLLMWLVQKSTRGGTYSYVITYWSPNIGRWCLMDSICVLISTGCSRIPWKVFCEQQTFAVQEHCKLILKQISGKGAEKQRKRSFASWSGHSWGWWGSAVL